MLVPSSPSTPAREPITGAALATRPGSADRTAPWPVPSVVAESLAPRGLHFGIPVGPTWVSCARLNTQTGVAESLSRVARANPGASAEVAASYLANWYAAAVVGPAIASYLLLRRVPDLSPQQMALSVPDNGWFDRTALYRPVATALPTDPLLCAALTGSGPLATLGPPAASGPVAGSGPAAGSGPGAPLGFGAAADVPGGGDRGEAGIRVAADPERLRAALVEEILAHLEPFLAHLRGMVRLGRPALWGAAAAQCARAFLLTERATGDPAMGRDEADAFFARAAPTMLARPRWQEFVHRGRSYVGMRRGSCCLAHQLDAEYCTTCPFTADADRETRMRAWIETQGDGGLAV
ncbi:putative Fe-S protein [Frankia sp. AiPs1]|uniref:(2Fe-2S)-binding protein n=1 Tax=Frankia sp. AiPa1 TaxID=573492 RepID=UPI00202B38D1|nr:(2Fe-2S)-binding protein [Frankia sp. AiPa1]MCL9759444.1 (2Fe-2S)-binding protein [Frankia sp. AiPa1]